MNKKIFSLFSLLFAGVALAPGDGESPSLDSPPTVTRLTDRLGGLFQDGFSPNIAWPATPAGAWPGRISPAATGSRRAVRSGVFLPRKLDFGYRPAP